MGILWRKILCAILMVCSLATACIVSASEISDPSLQTSEAESETIISPRASYIAAEANITSAGIYWRLPDGYNSYRVWIDNTTGALMTATITSPSGQTKNIYITSGSNQTYTNNDAEPGSYRVTFHTYADALSGTIRIRVSNMPL